jgi:hypothetical protein
MSEKTIEMEYPHWRFPAAWPYFWMVNDLYRGVQAEQNYLVALGLFSYSEAIGRIILNSVGKNDKGTGLAAYRQFTERYIGYSFTNSEWSYVFSANRNGLSHEFFIKNIGSKIYNDDGTAPCGIIFSNQTFEIRINSYFKHFVTGLEKGLDEGVLIINSSQ